MLSWIKKKKWTDVWILKYKKNVKYFITKLDGYWKCIHLLLGLKVKEKSRTRKMKVKEKVNVDAEKWK